MKVVLIAEDHAYLRRKIVELLGSVGIFTVVDVADGKQALDYLKDPTHHVDLLVTDQSMPEMKGLELVGAIRTDLRLAKLPVIMFSLCTPEEAKYALSHGVDAFIDKAAPIEDIEETVLRLLG